MTVRAPWATGHSGTVVSGDGGCVGVHLDRQVPDLDHWSNVLHHHGDHGPGGDPDAEMAADGEEAP